MRHFRAARFLGGLPAATRTGGGGTGTGFVIDSDYDIRQREHQRRCHHGLQFGRHAGQRSAPLGDDDSSTGPGHEYLESVLSEQFEPDRLPTDTTWTNVGQTFTFNSNGNLTSPTGGGITIPNLTVDGQAVGDVRTQLLLRRAVAICLDDQWQATVGQITQNGFAAGQLQSVAINN